MSEMLISDVESLLSDSHGLMAMMARVPIDMEKVLDARGMERLAEAIARCRNCYETAACDIWKDQHEEGVGAKAPGFCPVRDYLAACAPDPAGDGWAE